MEKKGSFHIRDARDDEREVIRDVTLAAYEEYAAILPPHSGRDTGGNSWQRSTRREQSSALSPTAMARSLAASCCIPHKLRPTAGP